MRKPIAWMLKKQDGNIVFFHREIDAIELRKDDPEWQIIALAECKATIEMTQDRITEIWHEQWAAHENNWAEEFVYHLGKAYEREVMELNK